MDADHITHRCEADLGLDALLQREWLLTNGSGAYAMSSAAGCNTRRYHGLLIAATQPPLGRIVALNQVLDELVLQPASTGDGPTPPAQRLELACCRFPGREGVVTAPRGDTLLSHFEKGLIARWVYRWGSITITRELSLPPFEQAATLRYRVEGLSDELGQASLRLRPLLTLRDFHALQTEAEGQAYAVDQPEPSEIVVERDGMSVTMSCPGGRFKSEPDWWYDLLYERDAERGQGDREHGYVPGVFEVPVQAAKSEPITLTVRLGQTKPPTDQHASRAAGLNAVIDHLPGDEALRPMLAIAADDFVVRRSLKDESLSTILAGYPWFGDWGRDTFIALPGLLLCTGRLEEARRVLKAFAGSLRNGLIPNRFDDYRDSEAHYNTLDASLWFVHAGLQYIRHGGSPAPWLLEAMAAVVQGYADGTEAESHSGEPIAIRMEDDGLITAGSENTQLTWMDAACGGSVFTPRPGKCVEINALWFAALTGLSDLHAQSSSLPDARRYAELASLVMRSFQDTFWSDVYGRLIDHVTPQGVADPSLRPNQVFAVSLTDGLLTKDQRKSVLRSIRDHLLTPMGLRTLPADDPAYHPHYGGPQYQRDEAYHQGTVWPWLIGPYAEAVLRVGRYSASSKREAANVIAPLLSRLRGEGLGQLAEIHDAEPTDAQHAERGCPAQAWSVAEVLRVHCLIERGPG